MQTFQVKIENVIEIRMGSPYNSCDIKLIGGNKINIPQETWQDRYSWSDDYKILVLVKWNFDNNEPGFHLFIVDTDSGKTIESPKYSGLLNTLAVSENIVKFNKFLFDKEKSVNGLCCTYDEEYLINWDKVSTS